MDGGMGCVSRKGGRPVRFGAVSASASAGTLAGTKSFDLLMSHSPWLGAH